MRACQNDPVSIRKIPDLQDFMKNLHRNSDAPDMSKTDMVDRPSQSPLNHCLEQVPVDLNAKYPALQLRETLGNR